MAKKLAGQAPHEAQDQDAGDPGGRAACETQIDIAARKKSAGQAARDNQIHDAGDPGGQAIAGTQIASSARKKSARHVPIETQLMDAGGALDQERLVTQAHSVEGDQIADQVVVEAQDGAVGNGADLGHVAVEDQEGLAEIRATVEQVREIGRQNSFAIRQRMRIRQATLSHIARAYFGYHTALAESERTKAMDAAAAVIKAIEDGHMEHPAMALVHATSAAAKPWEDIEKNTEKALIKLARKLPAYDWVKGVRGFGALSFARIIAETGDLSLYANPGKVWKRLGLAVVDGRAQRRTRDAEKAKDQGYSPRRRSVAYVAFEPVIKAQSAPKEPGDPDPAETQRATVAAADGAGQQRGEAHSTGAGPYRLLYDRKKAEYMARCEAQEEGWGKLDAKEKWIPFKLRAHMAAMRYASKALFRNLWVAWRRDIAGQCRDEAQARVAGDGARDGPVVGETQRMVAVSGAANHE